MKEEKKYWQDRDVEIVLGNLLRWGVIISSVVVLTGGIIFLLSNGNSIPDYHSFLGLVMPFHSLSAVLKGIAEGNGQAIIQAGIILLIATPIARILFSIIGFIRERDWLYILIASIVLAIIMTSMLLGIKA